MEVIFVSADASPDELMNYFKTSHGDWLAVQHGAILAEKLRSILDQNFEIGPCQGNKVPHSKMNRVTAF